MIRHISFPEDADFYEEVLLGTWASLQAHAAARGKSLVWAATTGEMAAKATNNWRRLLWMEAEPEFITWGDLAYLDRHKPGVLKSVMIVGDVDFEPGNDVRQMLSGNGMIRHEAILQFIRRLACEPEGDMVLLHREDWNPAFNPAEMIQLSEHPANANKTEAGQAKSGGCFIATACCGSSADPLVRDLQQFRDEVLAARGLGRTLAAAYSRFSPPMANWISRRAWARTIVRHTVVQPLAWVVRIAVRGPQSKPFSF
jgi:hypothetical protein